MVEIGHVHFHRLLLDSAVQSFFFKGKKREKIYNLIFFLITCCVNPEFFENMNVKRHNSYHCNSWTSNCFIPRLSCPGPTAKTLFEECSCCTNKSVYQIMKAIPALCCLMTARVDSASLTVMREKIKANLMLTSNRFPSYSVLLSQESLAEAHGSTLTPSHNILGRLDTVKNSWWPISALVGTSHSFQCKHGLRGTPWLSGLGWIRT